MTDRANAVEYRFYHPDPLGSNVLVTDRSGNVIQRTVSTPYGEIRSVVDGDGQSVGQSANGTRHLFTGQEHDPESDLHYYGARHYDPFVGRFLSVDPAMVELAETFRSLKTSPGNLNLYSYALNRPTFLVDPTGREPTPSPSASPIDLVPYLNQKERNAAIHDRYLNKTFPRTSSITGVVTNGEASGNALLLSARGPIFQDHDRKIGISDIGAEVTRSARAFNFELGDLEDQQVMIEFENIPTDVVLDALKTLSTIFSDTVIDAKLNEGDEDGVTAIFRSKSAVSDSTEQPSTDTSARDSARRVFPSRLRRPSAADIQRNPQEEYFQWR